MNEFIKAWLYRDVWFYLGWKDVSLKYRRAKIGVAWVPLNNMFFICFMAFIWSNLFKINLSEYLIFFAIGHIFWGFFSTSINDATSLFLQFESVIKQYRLPYGVYSLRVIFRNLFVLLLNLPIIFALMLIHQGANFPRVILSIMGIFLLAIFVFGLVNFLGVVCLRYRDIQQFIPSLMTLVFFASPIMWSKDMLGENKKWVAELNPIYHIFSIIRNPIIGTPIDDKSILIAVISSLSALVVGVYLVFKSSKKISILI